MKLWSKSWISSKKPKKQRKYRFNAPLHVKKNFLSVNLSKALRQKYGTRNLSVRKGDKVKIVRGQHRKKEGKVIKVFRKYQKIHVEGIDNNKKDGSKTPVSIQPSNVMILTLDLEDKKRKAKIEGINKTETKSKKETKTKEKK
jgi:large subunit ribosomal protein L24